MLTNDHISIHTRRRALECYIEPILIYGCAVWTFSKETGGNRNVVPSENAANHGPQRNQTK